MKLKNYKELNIYGKMVAYSYGFIDKADYLEEIYIELSKSNPEIIDIIYQYDIENDDSYLEEVLNYKIKKKDFEKINAQLIVLLSEEYDFKEFSTLKTLNEQYRFEFEVTYFLYNSDFNELTNDDGDVIMETTGNRDRDMDNLLQYYRNLATK